MSVDYTAGFAFGWHITNDEKWAMIEAYHDKTGNYDIEDYFIQINGYREDAGCIFGDWVSYFPEPGYCRKFDSEMIELPGQEWFDEFVAILRDTGRSDLALNIPASLWAIHSVW